MKALKCEICGSTDLIKQDGFFVCQYCGTKYSPEEAKKLMVEGTVKIDSSEKLNNLYKLARRARDEDNSKEAKEYYNQISIEDPDSWEAQFYRVLFSCKDIKIAEMGSACVKLANTIDNVFSLIQSNVSDENERMKCYREVIDKTKKYILLVMDNINDQASKYNDPSNRKTFVNEHMIGVGQLIIKIGYACKNIGLPESVHELYNLIYYDKDRFYLDSYNNDNIKNMIKTKIKEIDPNYAPPQRNSGCYVATCVYGSYDCPQVWTLRRYRDNSLAKTWYGRVFIRCYYAVSPTLVKWFGNTDWFKKAWKSILDPMICELKANGFSDTPYKDRNW